MTLRAQIGERTSLLSCQAGKLARAHFLGRNLNQLVAARIADEKGDFVIGGLAASFSNELANGFISLPAALAVPGEKLIGDPANLKPAVTSLRIDAIIDLISEEPHFTGQGIPVNLGEVRPALIDA